jgi:hypothetical protein
VPDFNGNLYQRLDPGVRRRGSPHLRKPRLQGSLVERKKVMVATSAPGVGVEFLAKSFATEKLLTLVREVLQKPLPVAN